MLLLSFHASNSTENTTNSPHPQGLGTKERHLVSALAALERPTVTADDIPAEASRGREAANLVLSRLARKGWLHRLRRGVYTVVPLSSTSGRIVVDDPLALAMELFAPCYISGWTAAEHWDLTEQVHNTIVVYSAKPQRRATQLVGGVSYRVRRIRPETIFGTVRLWSSTVAVEMADIHRTLIDVLDAPQVGGGGRQMVDMVRAYWAKPTTDPEALFGMAARLRRGTIFKRLGFTTERFGRADKDWFAACRKHLSAGVSLLDPTGPARGPIVTRWRLRINVPLGDEP